MREAIIRFSLTSVLEELKAFKTICLFLSTDVRRKKDLFPLYMHTTGFPKKDVRFSKIKKVFDLLSDDKEGKIM